MLISKIIIAFYTYVSAETPVVPVTVMVAVFLLSPGKHIVGWFKNS